ncbi:hypothetical protein [Natronincola ferrireducens]|uniref:DUF5667 domain-containing protein n=1 Tax=Natronincola ferrireducens TaxID=393762 RepID=A0A1G8XTJ5_9FIRM|nr:hypothetical protein [Natronincola ferrireducens]SDJ93494.1 hypothetical protein SAMN05660472_00315 [Natronincola ferrireducens]
MKKTLAFIISGCLLMGSAIYAFAGEGLVDGDIIDITVDVEDMEDAPEIDVDIIKELLEDLDLDLDEDELDGLIEEILDELEEELEDEDKDEDEVEGIYDEEDEDEDTPEEEISKEALQNLYLKLVKFQAIYDRVPDVAKPAIRKNIRKTELRILSCQISMGEKTLEPISPEELEALETQLQNLQEALLGEDLTEEEREALEAEVKTLEDQIKVAKETNEFIEFIENAGDWEKQLRQQIQQEFLAEKREVLNERKFERGAIKAEIKQQQEALKQQRKERVIAPIKAVEKQAKNKEAEATVTTTSVDKWSNNDRDNKSNNGNGNSRNNGNTGNQGRGNAANAKARKAN